MAVRIIVTIPGDIYKLINKTLKDNKVPKPDPVNPDAVILAPQYASVEAWIDSVIENNIAPIVANQPKAPEVIAIETEILTRQEALRVLCKIVTNVVKEETTPTP
jgi:hypothetical protein